MKRLLCLALTIVMVAVLAAAAIPASAELADTGAGILNVSVNGGAPVAVEVGNEFIVRVGLKAGEAKILNGQATIEYDDDYVAFVPYALYNEVDDNTGLEYYSFPAKVRNANLVYNFDTNGIFNYNFTTARGVDTFNDTSKLFAKFRFKATAAGSTDITHIIQFMINVNEERIYYGGQPSDVIKPSTAVTVEPATACIGDADKDNEVTILDATFMQRVAAGADLAYDATADVTGDSILSLKDALIVRKYLSGKEVESEVGEYKFASEA